MGTVLLHRDRLAALLLLGATGLVVALVFVLLSAPDLALTQVLVEVVTVVLMMLALNYLPARTPAEPGLGASARDVALAAARRHRRGGAHARGPARARRSISPFFLASPCRRAGAPTSST